MKSVFICTHIHDAHAILVQSVLEAAGHRVVRWVGADCPTRQTQTLEMEASPRVVFRSDEAEYASDEFDVIWWRRLTPALLPSNLHPGDVEVAAREWGVYYDSFANVFRRDALWVNSFEGQRLANDKVRQLVYARDAGFRIPKTLVSNNVGDIRAFVRSLPAVVHKMFTPTSWKNDERYARARTTLVSKEHLEQEESLRLCPGVFQERILKRVEIRATFMGEKCFAVEIDPKDSDDGICDWRSIPEADWRIRTTTLPGEVYARCVEVMHRLGIVFGCFDFIVSEEGEYVFLEVNQMGQFLWKEDDLPQLPLLREFCNFLVAAGKSSGVDAVEASVAGVTASERYKTLMAGELDSHVDSKPYLLDNAY
jgi:glutathione synthase/RimK-type ligase-like ATP-grasp enzyme